MTLIEALTWTLRYVRIPDGVDAEAWAGQYNTAQALTEKETLHIESRRWFQRTYGNTYHSVRIFVGDREHYIPFSYGYGEQWLQTALDWLASEGLAEKGQYGTRYLREELGGTYSCIDVTRKRDL